MRGFSLLEVMLAGVLLMLALVPAIGVLGTSTTEVVKSRDRAIAIQVASSVAEWLRSQRPADRANVPPMPATALPHLAPLVNAHAAAMPEWAGPVGKLLLNFRVSAVLSGTGSARVVVDWTEAGAPHRFELSTRLDPE